MVELLTREALILLILERNELAGVQEGQNTPKALIAALGVAPMDVYRSMTKLRQAGYVDFDFQRRPARDHPPMTYWLKEEGRKALEEARVVICGRYFQ